MIGVRCENHVCGDRLDRSGDLDRNGQCRKCCVSHHMNSFARRHDGKSVGDRQVHTVDDRVWLVHVDSRCWNVKCIRRLLISR